MWDKLGENFHAELMKIELGNLIQILQPLPVTLYIVATLLTITLTLKSSTENKGTKLNIIENLEILKLFNNPSDFITDLFFIIV